VETTVSITLAARHTPPQSGAPPPSRSQREPQTLSQSGGIPTPPNARSSLRRRLCASSVAASGATSREAG